MSELVRTIELFPVYDPAPELPHRKPLSPQVEIRDAFIGEGVRFVTMPGQGWVHPNLQSDSDIVQFSQVLPDGLRKREPGRSRMVGTLSVEGEQILVLGEQGYFSYASQAKVSKLLVFCDAEYRHHLPEGEMTHESKLFADYETFMIEQTGTLRERGEKGAAYMNRLRRQRAFDLEFEEREIAKHNEPLTEGTLTVDKYGFLHTICTLPVTNASQILPTVGSFQQRDDVLHFSLSETTGDVFEALFQAEQARIEAFRQGTMTPRGRATAPEIDTSISKAAKKVNRKRPRRYR